MKKLPDMKRWLFCLLLLALALLLAGCVPIRRQEPDYLAQLRKAALNGDPALGHRAERERNAALADGETPVSFDELLLLARYLDRRAGEARLTGEQRLCVGEVMLNRVASPEFPDTLEEVLYEAGFAAGTRLPGEQSVDAALALLLGRRLLEPRVVYQSEDKPVGAVYACFCDRYYRRSYFCLTQHPELYGED